jgi:WD40 repeat protein
MPPAEKQVRVFVSSTFRDMHAERDHLVTVVFPELRERVERLGLEFFDVDLRWGVPEKDVNGETANSWEYCRQWIDRVEPLFVCILGQRYGWVPEIKDFRDEADRARQASLPRSITDLEVRHAVLTGRRKQRSYFYLRETPVPPLLADATAEQRQIHDEFVDPPERFGQLEALKTEIRQCGRPVRSYGCRWTGQGLDDLDAFGRLVLDDLWSGVLRDPRCVSKEVWRQALGADPDTDPRYTDESHPVPQELGEKIVALAKPAPVSPLDAERQQMEAFAASRLKWFQGRTHELETLAAFIRSTDEDAPRLAVVAAVPGQGKSALLAKLWRKLTPSDPSAVRNPDSEFIIAHFIGATERSGSALELVRRLLDELDQSGIEWPEEKTDEEPNRDFYSLCARLSKRLGQHAGPSRIVLLIDALNQLSDGHDLLWLPQRFGPEVRVVVSCVDDPAAKDGSPEQRVLKALGNRQPGSLRIPLGPLTPEDVRTVVVEYLKEYCKELDREHVDALCALPPARNPLYLLVMLGELRTLGGNDMNRKVPELIASLPQTHPDTVSLFKWVLQRLEVFGAEDVKHWCLYLALGRVGMASRELADLLRRKLAEAAASKALLIERGLRRYLQRRGGQFDFFHGQLRQAVMEKYRTEEHEDSDSRESEFRSPILNPPCPPEHLRRRESAIPTVRLHHEMAEYFTACARGDDPKKAWETEAVRGFSECVYHFTQARDYDVARKLLGDFPFLLHKIRVGLLDGVFEDYESFETAAPADDVRKLEFQAAFFRERAHILRRKYADWSAHKIFLQLAAEHAGDSPLTLGADRWLADGHCDWIWFRRDRRLPHVQIDPCLATLEGHTGGILGVLELTDGRLLTWSNDRTLRLWDRRSGACLTTLGGHVDSVAGALELADGRLLSWGRVSYSEAALWVWDSRSGACLATLEGNEGAGAGALELPDGTVVSWGGNKLCTWDTRLGKCLAVLEGHTHYVSSALALPDGRITSWAGEVKSEDHALRIWDSRSGVCLATLKGHKSQIERVLKLADGNLLSWSGQIEDPTLRVWDSRRGTCLAKLKGHKVTINGARELADGRVLSWSGDKTLRVWDPRSGACLAKLKGHTESVWSALELADGRVLSWARFSGDSGPRVWDSRSGACLATLEGRGRGIDGVLELVDGRILSWWFDTLQVWDSRTGACLATLSTPKSTTDRVLELAGGGLLQWSNDARLREWDSRTGTCLATVDKAWDPPAKVWADGTLLSDSNDNMLRLWKWCRDAGWETLEGHRAPVKGALVLADGRVLSWTGGSLDGTLRVWHPRTGACLAMLEGPKHPVWNALELADGRILSWSGDDTLRTWDSHTGACLARLEGHQDLIRGALELADGRILSWAQERTLRVWDSRTVRPWGAGIELARLEGHKKDVEGALELADGRVLSWAFDNTLRVWDSHSGACLTTLAGHSLMVEGALELADGRVLSWSEYDLPRVWDTQSGACLAMLNGHPSWVALQKLAGGAEHGELTTRELTALELHSIWVAGAVELADGRLLSWATDDTVWVWDSRTGTCLDVFTVRGQVRNYPKFRPRCMADHATTRKTGSRESSPVQEEQSILEVLDPERVVGKHRLLASNHMARLHSGYGNPPSVVAGWEPDSDAVARYLLRDGTAVITLKSGQVCFLQLYHGNRPISIEEIERKELGNAPPVGRHNRIRPNPGGSRRC